MLKLLVVYGTRPEAIKMAPVIHALRRRPEQCSLIACAVAQHRDMLDQVQDLMELKSDIDLDLMREAQQLNEFSSRALEALDGVLQETKPDWLLVQGDTTTAMTAAMAAFHRQVRIGHVEAGLRTGDLHRPFPEEANRRVIDLLAAACFAPTKRSRDILLAEGKGQSRVFLTGNTVVDALAMVGERLEEKSPAISPETGDEILVTIHRRESFGEPIRAIFAAIAELADRHPTTRWIYPMHPNPRVRKPALELLSDLPNVELHEPFDYLQLVRTLRRCRLVLTDSGGIQEEAPSFGRPVLVLREVTERPEGIEAGIARLVGIDRERIVADVHELLTNREVYRQMATVANPYGDGRAADRIAAILTGSPWEAFDPEATNGDP